MSRRKDKGDGPERLRDVHHVAERLGVSRATAYRVMKRLTGRVYIGESGKRKQVRVPESALETFIASGGDDTESGVPKASIFRPGAAPEPMLSATTNDAIGTQRAKHWLKKLLDEPKRKPSGRTPDEPK